MVPPGAEENRETEREGASAAQDQGIEWESLNDEVMSLYRKGQYDCAVLVAKKALDVAVKLVGSIHPCVATSINNLALIYVAQGQYAEAEPLIKRSLAIYGKALGPDQPSRCGPLLEQTRGPLSQNRSCKEAESLQGRTARIREITAVR